MAESYSKPGKKSSTVSIVAEHPTDYAAITRPSKLVYCSDYFVRRWMPLLGGTGTQIVLALRRHGYHDRDEGRHREQVDLSIAQVAAEVGCSVRTLQREFAQNVYLSLFVQREKKYFRHPTTNHILREENRYHIHMEDPVHIDDQAAFDAAAAEVEKNAPRRTQNTPIGQNVTYEKSRKRQNGVNESQPVTPARQNDTSARQNGVPSRQSVMALNDTSDTEDKKNTLNTQESEVQKIELGEKEQIGLAPARAVVEMTWESLTDAERAPYLSEADLLLKGNVVYANARHPERVQVPKARELFAATRKGGA